MNELIKTLTGMLCFLLMTLALLTAHKSAWKEHTWKENTVNEKWQMLPDKEDPSLVHFHWIRKYVTKECVSIPSKEKNWLGFPQSHEIKVTEEK